ncbi:MAG: beta-galactosidase [bacterium]|nr:beta-galactosidase [bacterium]
MDITYDKNSLIVNGKRVFIKSGAFHYFRTPGVELAKNRFKKLKSAGYNAVDIYFNWGYHSPQKGIYDFDGLKDVRKILQTAKDTGLFVIARPGPFINAEISAGGLPLWLLKEKDVVPRNRINSTYHYSPKYMEYIKEWYDHIIPIIKEFDNVILFQIENEYSTDEMDETYLKELYQMARDRGITCPIFHNDAFNAGLWADVVDIYGSDIYPYINPNQNWKQDNFCFDTLDNYEDMVRMSKEDAPPFIVEMQCGWFDKWDGIGYKAMREVFGKEHINIMTKTAISQGVTLFNHYMAVGGTSWNNLACDEVYTSYEFTAGIDEYGSIKENFRKSKEINYFLNSFDLTNTGNRTNIEFGENMYAVTREDYTNNCEWLFIRNMNTETKDISFDSYNVNIKPFDMKICPKNLDLYTCKILFSDAEIFARIKDENKEIIFVFQDKNANLNIEFNGQKETISANKKDFENKKYEKDNKLTEFVFISREISDKTWIIDDKVIFNADYVYPNGRIAISENSEIAYFDIKNGFSKTNLKFEGKKELIELKDFEINFCAPELDYDYNYSTWDKLPKDTYDSLGIEKYEEFIFYKTQIPNNLEEITLSARHLFSVYINGKEIINRNSYKYEKLQQVTETISIQLNKEILNKDKNELTILVQNIGFDKGFSGETNTPRGLVEFNTTPKIDLTFYAREKFAFERNDKRESTCPYIARLSKTFKREQQEGHFTKPLYLSMKDFPYDRATIFINGIKIGRYLKNINNISLQEDFYLPEPFLKEENQIDIIIWEKDSHIKTAWDFKNDLKNVIIQVGDKEVHQIY